MSVLGFIGTGHIAAPMARHLAAKGHEVWVTERNREVSAALAEAIGAQVATPQAVVDAADTVYLCLRPHLAHEVIAPLTFRADQRIVSVMAGVSRDMLLADCAPAARCVQTIPLGYLEQGGCPLAAFGDTDLLADLFAPENPVVAVSGEAALNAHFAICALVPGMLELLDTGADWLAGRTGDRAAAEFYTAQLLAGFLDTIDRGATGVLARERDALATGGTLSLMMVEGMRTGGANAALTTALNGIDNRLKGGGR